MGLVGCNNLRRGPSARTWPWVQPQRLVTQALHVVEAVRAEQNGATVGGTPRCAQCIFSEMLVTHGQGFINDEHLRLQCSHQGKAKRTTIPEE